MSHDHSQVEEFLYEISRRHREAQQRFEANLALLPQDERMAWLKAKLLVSASKASRIPLTPEEKLAFQEKAKNLKLNIKTLKPVDSTVVDRVLRKMRKSWEISSANAQEIVASLNGMTVEEALEKRVSEIS